ncbi:MAG: hypothetical protein M1836_004873 [Candelina mexicana]|nr:MAG: hypothetical protein M1836_004873 [Candelina mexicana]
MTSQSGDNNAIDHKTQQIGTFDKMTVDSDIPSEADNIQSTPDYAQATDTLRISPPTEIHPSALASNAVSFSENKTNGVPSNIGPQAELLDAGPANSPAIPLENVNPTDLVAASSFSEPIATSVLPVVEAPISEVRQETGIIPVEEADAIPPQELGQEENFGTDESFTSATGPVTTGEATTVGQGMDVTEDSTLGLATTTVLPHHPPVPVPEGATLELPVDPAPTPVEPAAVTPPVDHEMREVPFSPSKVARGREDDDMEDGPAAKRTRTDADGSGLAEFKVPDLPQPAQISHDNATPAQLEQNPPSRIMTKARSKHLLHGLKNQKRTKDAAPFSVPVDPVKLNIPTYLDVIKHPMDLGTMEEKLKEDRYASVEEYIGDFDQIVQNATKFNGPEHTVTKMANNLRPGFERSLLSLPAEDVAEPSSGKKAKKPQLPPAPKATPARRESRSSLGNSHSPGASAGSPQTFALNPQGMPLIRRDSTLGDGRPKREIHPPAPRDLPYSTAKPKKKKYQAELKFCQEVLSELEKPKYRGIGYAFYNPVDPVALNIPHYHKIIKKPMDLGTISSKLKNAQYENAKEFESDIRLMFQNCYKFNPATDPVNQMGKQFEKVFDEQWATKKEWLEDHAPQSGPQTPGSSPEPDDEDEEEEEEEEEEDNQLTILQKQIAAMSKQVEMIQKKKNSPPASSKKGTKAGKPTKKGNKKGANPTAVPPPFKSEKKGAQKVKKEAKEHRAPYVTYEQKQDISSRINSLPEARMQTALKIIRENMPQLKNGVQEEEIELDIDELSNDVLYKLLQFVRKYAPSNSSFEAGAPLRAKDSPAPKAPSSKPKKNKPMSKYEQEARISELQGRLAGFHNPTSDDPPEPTVKGEAAKAESSGDESESGSESEEE